MGDVKKSALPFTQYSLKETFEKLKLLVYSDTNVGKTVLAGSIVKVTGVQRALYLDIGANTSSLSSFGYNLDALTMVRIDGFTKGEGNLFVDVLNYVVANPDAFDALVIDNATNLQPFMIQEILTATGKSEPDLKVWGKLATSWRTVAKKIKDLPIHVIMAASEKGDVDDDTGVTRTVPGLVGKFAKEVIGYFDIVGRLVTVKDDDGNLHRVIAFEGDDSFVARDNTRALKTERGRYLVDTDLADIFELITSKHNLGEK